MLTYTQRLFLGQFRSVYAANLVSELIDKSGQALVSIFSPEDTTNYESSGQMQITRHNAYNIGGLAKTVFWVAISISIALWIGRLS